MQPATGADRSGLASFLEDFRGVERADPGWTAIHLAAAAAWLVALPLSNAAEGIAFGVMAAVSAVRTVRTAPLYGRMFRSTPWLLFMAFLTWQALSVTWSCDPGVKWSSGLSRMALVPLMLWPLAHRAGTIAVALGASGAIAGGLLLAMNLSASGMLQYGDAKLVGKDLGMTAACVSTALVTIVVAPGAGGKLIPAIRIAAGTLAAGGLVVLSKRAEFVAVPAGIVAGSVHVTRHWIRRRPGRMLAAAAIACIAVALVATTVPRMRTTASRAMGLLASNEIDARSLAQFTDSRSILIQVALEMAEERPLLGWGAGAFHAQLGERCARMKERAGDLGCDCEQIAAFKTSHNMIADELCMRGIVGCGLLLAMLGCLLRWCWRDPAGGIALGMLAVWCVHGMINGTTVRGTHMALLAAIVSRASFVMAAARR